MTSLSGARRLLVTALLAGIPISRGLASKKAPDTVDPRAAAALAGEWGAQIKMPDHTEEAILRFRFDGRILAGSLEEADRDPRELTNIRLDEGKIWFEIEESTGTTHAQGIVNGEIMSGKMKFQPLKGEDAPSFSLGGGGGSSGGRRGGGHEGRSGRPEDRGSRQWIAYKRHTAELRQVEPPPKPAETVEAAPQPPNPSAEGQPTDHRFHVSYGALSRTDTIVLTPEGARVAFTPSFSIPTGKFAPDPYSGRCKFVAVKYTLKEEDKKSVLGDQYTAPEPESDDDLVLHPFELRNAAARFGANAVYLLLNDSEALEKINGLHDCTIVSKDGSRYRGELLNEVACRNEQGKTFKLSEYGGRASFYSCSPGKGESSEKRRRPG